MQKKNILLATSSISVAGSSFLISLLLISFSSSEDFGFFSLLQITQALTITLVNAIFFIPKLSLGKDVFKVIYISSFNWLLVCSFLISFLMAMYFYYLGNNINGSCIIFGYIFTNMVRSFFRCELNLHNKISSIAISEWISSIVLLSLVLFLYLFYRVDFFIVSVCMFISSLSSLFYLCFKTSVFFVGSATMRESYLFTLKEKGFTSLINAIQSDFISNFFAYFISFKFGVSAISSISTALLLYRPSNLLMTTYDQILRPKLYGKNEDEIGVLFRDFKLRMMALFFVNFAFVFLLLLVINFLDINIGEMDIEKVILVIPVWFFILAFRVVKQSYLIHLQYLGLMRRLNSIYFTSLVIVMFLGYFFSLLDVSFVLVSMLIGEIYLVYKFKMVVYNEKRNSCSNTE